MFMDDGRTALSVATRTSSSVSKKGVTPKFKSLVYKMVKEDKPEWTSVVTAIPTATFPHYWDKQLADRSQKSNCALKFVSR